MSDDPIANMQEAARNGAAEMRIWFDAYITVGFTPSQAIALLARSVVQVSPPLHEYPPEMMEAMERQTALATKFMAAMDDA